jgi:hypothetical protein
VDESESEELAKAQVDAVCRLAMQTVMGIYSEQEAVSQIRAPGFPLSQSAALSVADYVHRVVARDNPLLGRLTALLVLEGCEARWGARMGTVWGVAADSLVEATRISLADHPDAGHFRRACEIADEQIRQLRVNDVLGELADTLYAAAVLRVDPHAARIDAGDPIDTRTRWEREETRLLWFDPVSRTSGDAPLPDPSTCAQEALQYLEEAIRLSEGPARGRYLRAATVAIGMLAFFDGRQPWMDEVLPSLALEGLALIDPDADPLAFVSLLRVINAYGNLEVPSALTSILPEPLPDLKRRLGEYVTAAIAFEAMRLLRDTGQVTLERELIAAIDETFGERIDERLFTQILVAGVHDLPGSRIRCPAGQQDFAESATRTREQARTEGWTAAELAVTLIHLAGHARPRAEAGAAVEAVLEQLEKLEQIPRLPASSGQAVSYLIACLAFDDGLTLLHYGDHRAATDRLGMAAGYFAAVDLPGQALESLEWMLMGIRPADYEMAAIAAISLAAAAPAIRASRRETSALALHDLCLRLSAALVHPAITAAHMLFIHQAAKGLDFGMARSRPGPRSLPATGRRLLERIAEAEQAAVQAGISDEAEEFRARDIYLLCYADFREAASGENPSQVLANMRRAFDRQTSRRLLVHSREPVIPGHNPRYLMMDDLQALLPDDTVLVSVFLAGGGSDGGGEAHAYANRAHVMMVTRDDVLYHVITLGGPAGLVQLAGGPGAPTMHPAAMVVDQLRSAVTAGPVHARRNFSHDAEEQLSRLLPGLFGPHIAEFARWRQAGKRHLVFWPNGPLHYLPFHLLHSEGRPLADDWTVTLLPELSCLARELPPRPGEGTLISVASADGGTAYGLGSNPAMDRHAAEIAGVAGGRTLLGAEATPQNVLCQIPGATYLHIAAHGSHYPAAAWFQCLYLNRGPSGDGRLFAHQILQSDLSGMDLVTLSSCESALGRFDINDNLRGLPAALFIAGVSTVVGCLWPVGPAAATLFFTTLYSALREGQPKLAAFRHAQLTTRQHYPRYRDWGAFCLLGDWRDRPQQ